MGDASRKKNIGFKAKGKDTNHDRAFSILDSLPRGTISDFVAIAISEYLDNHVGEITIANRRKVVIVRADISSALPDIQKHSVEPSNGNRNAVSPDSTDANAPTDERDNSYDHGDGREELAHIVVETPDEPPPIDDSTLSRLIGCWDS